MGGVRFLLASLVVLGHLTGIQNFLHMAFYSVFAFYVLSGFLITEVCKERYPLNLDGGRRFAINRWLRLYPAYYAVLVLSIFLVLSFGDQVAQFHENILLPETGWQWFGNLSIIGLIGDRPMRLVPPVWSVAYEIFWYGVIWLYAARSSRNALTLLALSVIYTLWMLYEGMGLEYRYSSLWACAFPFAVGACCSWYKTHLSRLPNMYLGLISGICIANFSLGTNHDSESMHSLFYLNVMSFPFLLIFVNKVFPRWDILGKLSYPIFLCHWQVGLCIWLLGLAPTRSMELFLIAYPVTLVVAYVIHYFVEKPVELARVQFRSAMA